MKRQSNSIVERLVARKATIEKQIADELNRPRPNKGKLHDLKRARRSLTDNVTRILSTRTQDVLPIPARVY